MGMSEEMDPVPDAGAIHTPADAAYLDATTVRTGSERLEDDLRWFDDEFERLFPNATDNDRFLGRYCFIMALQRAADYEQQEVERIQLNMQEALAALHTLQGEFD